MILDSLQNSVSLLFFNWIKDEMIFYHISELMLATEGLLHSHEIYHINIKQNTHEKPNIKSTTLVPVLPE